MTDLKTNPALLKALKEASTVAPSAEEISKQRVSFIMGVLKGTSDVSRDRVKEVLAEQEGKRTS